MGNYVLFKNANNEEYAKPKRELEHLYCMSTTVSKTDLATKPPYQKPH